MPQEPEHFDIEVNTVDGVTTYKVNGREYNSLDELPPAVRKIIENLQKKPGTAVDGGTIYEINGKEYKSIDDVPPEFHGLLAGVHGIGGGKPLKVERTGKHTSEHIFINGKEYKSLDEVPPHLRKTLANLREGTGTTIEYITENGVTRKFVNGKEVPMRPGEQPGFNASTTPADSRSRHGLVHLGGREAETHKQIVAGRPKVQHKYKVITDTKDTSPYRMQLHSREAIATTFGYVATGISYAALILWSQLVPAGWGSYLFVSLLVGDIASKIYFGHFGHHEEIIKPELKGFIMQGIGIIFFVILVYRGGVFEGPIQNQVTAVVFIGFLSVVVMFIKLAALALKRMTKL